MEFSVDPHHARWHVQDFRGLVAFFLEDREGLQQTARKDPCILAWSDRSPSAISPAFPLSHVLMRLRPLPAGKRPALGRVVRPHSAQAPERRAAPIDGGYHAPRLHRGLEESTPLLGVDVK